MRNFFLRCCGIVSTRTETLYLLMLSNISYMNSWIFMGDDRHGGVRDLSETTFRLSQSCCRPEGDQKRSDRGEKFLGYFSLRTSVVQQPETFVQNSNFANASLLRNLVLHYSFHLKTPPWKLWQHENLFEVLVDEGSARVVVNLFPKWVVGSAHVIEPITQILFAQWELTAEKFLEGVTLFCVPNLNISLWINAVPLILLGRGSYGSYKMNIIDKNSVPILGTGPREKDNCKSEYVCRKVWGRKWPLYFGLLKAIL